MAVEKVLKNRRKRPASKGRIIRVSDRVFACLQEERACSIWRKTSKESFDCLLRRVLGLPDRKGRRPALLVGWIEVNSGQFYFDEADARGAAVMAAARNKTKSVKKPIRVREIA